MERCIYCDRDRPDSEFTTEHIFPRSLGGDLLGDEFSTRHVCRSCNSTCGLFVDGELSRSFFTKNDAAIQALQYLDFDKASALPLHYFGHLQGLTLPSGYVCELWLSPCSGRILHIHKNYSEKFYSHAGGNPIRARTNPGTAIFLNASSNEDWTRVGLKSFVSHFRDAKLVLANVNVEVVDTPPSQTPVFSAPTQDEREIMNEYVAQEEANESRVSCKASMALGVEERFLAKAALGVGHKRLGNAFLLTEHSRELRNLLWEQDCQARGDHYAFAASDYFGERVETYPDRFKWDGGITISFVAVGQFLSLRINLYGRNLSVLVSDEPSLWENFGDLSGILGGTTYVIVPQRNFCSGPIPIEKYISHRLGQQQVQALYDLESMRIDPSTLPPRH